MEKISFENLSGNAYLFAALFNNMKDAGCGDTFALEIAAQVVSDGMTVKCNCKK